MPRCHRPRSLVSFPLAWAVVLLGAALGGCGDPAEPDDARTSSALTPSTSSTYTIAGVQSGKCLEIPNGVTTLGVQAAIATCNGATRQLWRAEAVGGAFRLRNVATNLCADVEGASTSNGARIIQWTCGTQNNQLFTTPDVSAGIVRVVSAGGGKVWDVLSGRTADGSPVAQWTWNGGSNQQFRFTAKGGLGASCVSSAGCASGSCVDGVCVSAGRIGQACLSSAGCASGSCVDGVCCSTGPCGTCRSCNVPGQAGTCAPLPSGTSCGAGVACNGAGTCGP